MRSSFTDQSALRPDRLNGTWSLSEATCIKESYEDFIDKPLFQLAYTIDRNVILSFAFFIVKEEICLEAKAVHMPRARHRTGKPTFNEVYCGAYFTYAVTTDGDIFAFGLNNYNQLGLCMDISSIGVVKCKGLQM